MDELHIRRQRRSFAHAVYHARLHASDEEAVDLDRLLRLHRLGALSLDEARSAVAEVRRGHLHRAA